MPDKNLTLAPEVAKKAASWGKLHHRHLVYIGDALNGGLAAHIRDSYTYYPTEPNHYFGKYADYCLALVDGNLYYAPSWVWSVNPDGSNNYSGQPIFRVDKL